MTQLDEIVTLVHRVLGTDAIGAYLHGSAVLGQLRPRSDTDVLVVTGHRLDPAQRRALVQGLMALSGRRAHAGPARPIELTIVVDSDVRPWRYPPRSEFQYGEWLRDDYERGEVPAAFDASPDLAPLISMVLLGNSPLFGPPPAQVLDPVPHPDLIHAIVAGIPGLLDDLESDAANVVLTLARIWATVVTGAIHSKDAAADWALLRLPEEHRAVLARARAVYLGDADDERWGELQARLGAHADFVVGEIDRAGTGRGRRGGSVPRSHAGPDVPPSAWSPTSGGILGERHLSLKPEVREMTKDRVRGEWDQAKGVIKEKVGKITGDRSTELSGKLDQIKGKVEKKIGEAKDKLRRR